MRHQLEQSQNPKAGEFGKHLGGLLLIVAAASSSCSPAPAPERDFGKAKNIAAESEGASGTNTDDATADLPMASDTEPEITTVALDDKLTAPEDIAATNDGSEPEKPRRFGDIEVIKISRDQKDVSLEELTFPQRPLLGNRNFMYSHLRDIFYTSKGSWPELNRTLIDNIYKHSVFFGGPCNVKSGYCYTDPVANAHAETVPTPSTARSGYLMRACRAILAKPKFQIGVMKRMKIERGDLPTDERLAKAVRLFLPGLNPTEKVLDSLKNLFNVVRDQEGGSTVDAWSQVFLSLCEKSDDTIDYRKRPAAYAATPNPVDVFDRCFSQLTQDRWLLSRPKSVKTIREKVAKGEISPVKACSNILNRVKLQANKPINKKDVISVRLLNNLHELHASWFRIKRFPNVTNIRITMGTRGAFDPQQPALYLTRALFDDKFRFRDALLSGSNLTALRASQKPTTSGADSGLTSRPGKQNSSGLAPYFFAPRGVLYGFEAGKTLVRTTKFVTRKGTPIKPAKVNLSAVFGGGFFSTQAYLLANIGEIAPFYADGADKMARRWSRSIFHDVLCRNLPVTRPGDVASLVVEKSKVSFRTLKVCTNCHASTDQLAGAVRNVQYLVQPRPGGPSVSSLTPATGIVTMGGIRADPKLKPEQSWASAPVAKYHLRPPTGLLMFRDYNGDLKEIKFKGLSGLGKELVKLPDPYICLAKRYYEYFTGIDVDIGDVDSGFRAVDLTERDRLHRNFVISLGKKLMEHQSPRTTISEILSSDFYQIGK